MFTYSDPLLAAKRRARDFAWLLYDDLAQDLANSEDLERTSDTFTDPIGDHATALEQDIVALFLRERGVLGAWHIARTLGRSAEEVREFLDDRLKRDPATCPWSMVVGSPNLYVLRASLFPAAL